MSLCFFHTKLIKFVVLDGEVAVPCYPQSAIAGLMPIEGFTLVRSGLGK